MHKPSEAHEQLISLQRLRLDGRSLDFTQAFLSVSVNDNVQSWGCTLRGVPVEDISRLRGELELRAQAIDSRTIEGRVLLPAASPGADTPAVLELTGLESLLIEGREL